jgi:Bacterial mobilisation protein (MobC)
MRRRRVAGGRHVPVQVKFTAAEYQSVVARAVAAGLTVPSYLALSGLRPHGVASTDIKAALINARGARRVLAGVGNNLNQLTAKLHSTGEVDVALPAVVAAVERIAARVDQAVVDVAALVTGGAR